MFEKTSFQTRPKLRDNILWLDLETTGSDETAGDEIIEIGCVLTTYDLKELGEFTSVVKPGPMALGRLLQNPVVAAMHKENGLLVEVLEAEDTLKPHHVVKRVLSWLEESGGEKSKTVLAGSGVGHFDKRFLHKYMPQLDSYLRYWVVDIGVVRRAHDFWVGTTISAENDNKTHRALDDVYCHLREARAFAEMWRSTQGV